MRRGRGHSHDQALLAAALGARQHHSGQWHRLGSAASIYLSAPCGVEANADFAAIRARVQKMADIGPAFESMAKRREAKARAAEAAGNAVTARDKLVHGGHSLRRRRVALRRLRTAARRAPQQEAGMLCQLCAAR